MKHFSWFLVIKLHDFLWSCVKSIKIDYFSWQITIQLGEEGAGLWSPKNLTVIWSWLSSQLSSLHKGSSISSLIRWKWFLHSCGFHLRTSVPGHLSSAAKYPRCSDTRQVSPNVCQNGWSVVTEISIWHALRLFWHCSDRGYMAWGIPGEGRILGM